MTELMIAALVGMTVMCVGGAVLLILSARQQSRLAARIATGSVAVENEGDGRQVLMGMLDKLGNRVSAGRTSVSLKEELARAGFHSDGASAAYIGIKVLLMMLGIVIGVMIAMTLQFQFVTGMLIGMMCSAALFFLPNIFLDVQRKKRKANIRRHLPDAVDLLEISIAAGMGLDQAWNAVTVEINDVSTTLADEMALTNLEMHLGASRAAALRHLADRCGADELSSLVAVIVQSERFGSSVTDAMRTFASSMRESRSLRAQEEAETMAVKLIFPMILFLFPAVVLVTAGPAGMSLIKAVAHR
jgi:tight adherence protein C